MDKATFRALLRKYSDGIATRKEQKQLENTVLRNPIKGDWEWKSEEEKVLTGIHIKKGIDSLRSVSKQKVIWKYWSIGIAASIMLILSVIWFWSSRYESETKKERLVINESTVNNTEDITLTLSDGSFLNLEELKSGIIQETDGFSVIKKEGGEMVYETLREGSHQADMETKYNVIHVPNGKQFQIKLSDGTKIWLNTASTLTYPVCFGSSERRISLEGEAYFEVAHDRSRPFQITARHTEIAVTGTHFNVSAYVSDKAVTTTLLEGGVDVNKDGKTLSLGPGYKAITHADREVITKEKADVEQALAWKNGYFVFDGMDIVSVMRSVARWYDIKIVVEGGIPAKQFGGTFPLNATLDELLTDLGMLGDLTFERKGKKIVIVR